MITLVLFILAILDFLECRPGKLPATFMSPLLPARAGDHGNGMRPYFPIRSITFFHLSCS
jgi:hypothetical protein